MAGAGVEGELTQEVILQVGGGSFGEEFIRGTIQGVGTAERAVFQQ